MNHTQIEWVKNPDGTPGYTFNPITGCLNHINGICKGGGFPCYAYRLANGRLKSLYLANQNIALPDNLAIKNEAYSDPFYPRFWPERLDGMKLYTGVGKGIFTCDMSDLFGVDVPEEWTRKVLGATQWNTRNRFYLLTKQPQNLIKFSPFPDNCWVGVTACNQKMHNEAIACLSGIEAKVKFISYEPLLNEIVAKHAYDLSDIDWVIIGAQTKPSVYPKIEWVQEIVEAADKAGIPVFLKDNLRPLFEKPFVTYPYWAWRKGNLRQEMPK